MSQTAVASEPEMPEHYVVVTICLLEYFSSGLLMVERPLTKFNGAQARSRRIAGDQKRARAKGHCNNRARCQRNRMIRHQRRWFIILPDDRAVASDSANAKL